MFESARFKLTAWYLVIIICISLAFSVIIYNRVVNEVVRFEQLQRFRIERMRGLIEPLPINTELVEETRQRVVILLAIINGSIVVISSALGYFLAGKTLRPISNMVEAQNRFISDASHELKTPLTSLKSAFEVYLRDKQRTVTDADTLVGESITEVDKLQYLSESLLKLSRGQAVKQQLVELINLTSIIETSVKKVATLAADKHIQVKQKLNEVKLNGNKYTLGDLVIILLDNAIKYTADSGRVDIKLTKSATEAIITVSDTGQGISKQDLPHIFDRFFRSDSARSKNSSGGYGLGLSIAKQIVAEHRGQISASSKLNTGTTVTVHLPRTLS